MKKFDYIIIGSGFGGSVSALRLSEKGYKVAIIEQGKRYRAKDFPKTNWNFKKFFWFPKIGYYGIQALTLLKDVFILHGAGVGGGSLVYANNLLVPSDEAFDDPAWGGTNWKVKLLPFYLKASKMLGVTQSKVISHGDKLLKECAEDAGVGNTFHLNDVGIYFGEPGKTVSDPYFNGKGPERTGCILCGGCMVGCQHGAKNTLDLNYLYLAEQLGVEVIPETRVLGIKPIEQNRYEITTKNIIGFFKNKIVFQADGVIFSGGVMGSVKLLHQCKVNGFLPRISDQLGNFVRTNSEAIQGVIAKGKDVDYSKGIAISSGIYPDKNTHIEACRYGKGQGAMALLATILVDKHDFIPRPLLWLWNIILHPIIFLRSLNPFGVAEKSTYLLVMQTFSNYMRFDYKRRWWRFGKRSMNSNCNTKQKVPAYIPVANEYTKRMAEKVNGDPVASIPEILLNTSTTAHILGGCIMADSPEKGVTDYSGHLFGYDNLFVVDGSIVPSNLGVNPSLTITALAEYIMDQFPEKCQ